MTHEARRVLNRKGHLATSLACVATSGIRAVLVERLKAALVDEQAASRRSERRERGVDKLTKG